jgi:hypothetical protein
MAGVLVCDVVGIGHCEPAAPPQDANRLAERLSAPLGVSDVVDREAAQDEIY